MRVLAQTVRAPCRNSLSTQLLLGVGKNLPRSLHTSVRLAKEPRSVFAAPDVKKPFFVTTPIFYVNAEPHIGHLHSLILTDVIARYARLRQAGREVFMTTGTDEHGLKIQQAAALHNLCEQDFCDSISQRFKALADAANIEYTDFIRTSEERHYRAVEDFWAKLVASGDLYKGTHAGWYSVSDECFYSDGQVQKDGLMGTMHSIETGNEVHWEEEVNWKFKLSKYKDRLREWIERDQSISPENVRKAVLDQVESLEDLSISRPRNRVKWGVPVPGDPEHTIYVWIDALINYLTVLGYPSSSPPPGWPADIHVVGKDIVRFHAIYWPALLMAAGFEPPQRILAHAHWTRDRLKMSKSKGNVVSPFDAISVYGSDVIRWYLMRSGGSLPVDANYSPLELHNSYLFLAGQYGNLLSRTLSKRVVAKLTDGSSFVKDPQFPSAVSLSKARETYESRMESLDIGKAQMVLQTLLGEATKLYSEWEPWVVSDPTIPLVYCYETMRIVGILSQVVMPLKSKELLDRIGVPADERTWEHAAWSLDKLDVADVVDKIRRSAATNALLPVLVPKLMAPST